MCDDLNLNIGSRNTVAASGLQVCEALQGDNIPQLQTQRLAGQRNVCNRQSQKALKDCRTTADSCYCFPVNAVLALVYMYSIYLWTEG